MPDHTEFDPELIKQLAEAEPERFASKPLDPPFNKEPSREPPMSPDTIDIIRHPDLWGSSIRLANLRVGQVMIPTWQSLNDDKPVPPAAYIPIDDMTAQGLFDDLWRKGFRPTGTTVVLEEVVLDLDDIYTRVSAVLDRMYMEPFESDNYNEDVPETWFTFEIGQPDDGEGYEFRVIKNEFDRATGTGPIPKVHSVFLDQEELFSWLAIRTEQLDQRDRLQNTPMQAEPIALEGLSAPNYLKPQA